MDERLAMGLAIAALMGEKERALERGEMASAVACQEAWVALERIAARKWAAQPSLAIIPHRFVERRDKKKEVS